MGPRYESSDARNHRSRVRIAQLHGYLDAREGFPVARRQFLQLGLIVVTSIPVFLAPPIAYVLLYWTRGGSFRISSRDDDEA